MRVVVGVVEAVVVVVVAEKNFRRKNVFLIESLRLERNTAVVVVDCSFPETTLSLLIVN